MNKYWTIRIEDAAPQWHLFALQEKGDCFLSANTKIVGFDKLVQLTSEELAKSYIEAVMPTLRRRHGDNVQALLCICQTRDNRVDDEMVKARIAEGMFTPNKRPASPLETVAVERNLRAFTLVLWRPSRLSTAPLAAP